MVNNGSPIFLLILAVSVFLVIVGIWWGLNSIDTVNLDFSESHECTEKIEKLSKEYGFSSKGAALFLENTDFYVLDLSGWVVPFSGSDCRIVEDKEKAMKRFKLIEYNKAISDIPDSFFESTLNCYDIAGSRGLSNICATLKPVKDIRDSKALGVVAEIRTHDAEKAATALVSEEWKKPASFVAGSGISLIKTVKATNTITLGIDLIENSSCNFANTPKKAIFDLSNEGNKIFQNAKNNYYKENTIENIDAIVSYIITFEKVDFTPSINLPEAPKDVVGLIPYLFAATTETVSYVTSSVSASAIEAISVINDPACSENNQTSKFQGYLDKVSMVSVYAEQSYESFNSKLNEFKSKAETAIDNEKELKKLNGPKIQDYFLFPIKSLFYHLQFSNSISSYKQQLYLTAEKEANNNYDFYPKYWKQVTIIDIALSILLWSSALFIGVILLKSHFNK